MNFRDADINKFILFPRKDIFIHMSTWMAGKDFMKHYYLKKILNMEGTKDADFIHSRKVWKSFKIKNLGAYHDVFVQSDMLLLTEIFENFKNMNFWNI